MDSEDRGKEWNGYKGTGAAVNRGTDKQTSEGWVGSAARVVCRDSAVEDDKTRNQHEKRKDKMEI